MNIRMFLSAFIVALAVAGAVNAVATTQRTSEQFAIP